MERGKKVHVLIVPYPTQGHVNPMLQFCESLSSIGLHTTVALTTFIFNTFKPNPAAAIHWDTISDGYDEGGRAAASSSDEYLVQIEIAGTKTLADLIRRHQNSDRPIHAVVYDALMPWALDVAKSFGLVAAPFFTQPCSVNLIYYWFREGLVRGSEDSWAVSAPGLPLLHRQDIPSFISAPQIYPQHFHLVLNQWSNTQRADWILVNSIYEFEPQFLPISTSSSTKLAKKIQIPTTSKQRKGEMNSTVALNFKGKEKSEHNQENPLRK